MSKYLSDRGIKNVAALERHIKSLINREVICSKEASGVKVVWCYNNLLYSWFIEASVIYVIQEDQIDELINKILFTIDPVNTYLHNIASDYQFDKDSPEYCGFLNTEPGDSKEGILFINSMQKYGLMSPYNETLKMLGLHLEPGYSLEETVFTDHPE